MKILVLGGTGAMGVHLVNILASDGHNVIVSSRSFRKNRENVKYVQGDAHELTFLKSLLDAQHYEAIVDFMTYTTSDFASRKDMLLNATDQYFFLSTSRIYADTPLIMETSPRILDTVEDEEYLATDEYALCKARQEDILRNSGRCNFTIIRPYKTYSENRLQLGALDKETVIQRALSGHSVVVSRDIMEHITTLTYGYDVSKCIALLIGNPKAYGEIFHIATSQTISWTEVLDIYMEAVGRVMGGKSKSSI